MVFSEVVTVICFIQISVQIVLSASFGFGENEALVRTAIRGTCVSLFRLDHASVVALKQKAGSPCCNCFHKRSDCELFLQKFRYVKFPLNTSHPNFVDFFRPQPLEAKAAHQIGAEPSPVADSNVFDLQVFQSSFECCSDNFVV